MERQTGVGSEGESPSDVPWGDYPTAYGATPLVGDLLRRLEASDWLGAWAELSNLLNHQGTVYAAAVPATRFLLTTALRAPVPEPSYLFFLLGCLVHGQGSGTPAIPDPVGSVREQVAARADEIAGLMQSGDDQLAVAVMFVVGGLEDVTPRCARALQALKSAGSPYVRGSAMLTLARRGLVQARDVPLSYEDEEWRDAVAAAVSAIQRHRHGSAPASAVEGAVEEAALVALTALDKRP